MDPSQMSDEELAAAITTPQPEETPTNEAPVASPSESQEKEETPESPVEETPAEPEQSAEEEPAAPQAPQEAPAPSRREQLRVADLLGRGFTPKQQVPLQPSQSPNYKEMLEAEPEVYKRLDESAQQFGKDQYDQGQKDVLKQVQSVEWRTLLHIDAPQVEAEYSVLNPKSPDFHPALADTLNRLYLNNVGHDPETGIVQNPGVRYKDFVDSYMELADEIAVSKTTTSTKNIAKQVAATGLRPDGSTAKKLNLNQSEKTMSIEELYAAIGQNPPQ